MTSPVSVLARCLFCLLSFAVSLPAFGEVPPLWSLEALDDPRVPATASEVANPIDAFLAASQEAHALKPAGIADRASLLRRVYLDLIGLPPSPADEAAFLDDQSPDAYQKVVDRLLASEQHGVRYGRHWLDVLRYADADENMRAAPGIHLWRDWVIRALNNDLPYDQFVRAQLTGYRTTSRTAMTATGQRFRVEPRPDDLFALGFLARGAVLRDGGGSQELALSAVETVSSAFMGLTVGCAKCHNHFYDPITQRDFYAMKALFDPLVLRKVLLATPAEMIEHGNALDALDAQRAAIEGPLQTLIAPYHQKLYDERVAMLPGDVQAIIRKSEKERSLAEQKIADDYYPVLRIDSGKLAETMPPETRKQYEELQRRLDGLGGGRRSDGLPAFWTVEVDPKKAEETSYVLTSGDSERPEKDKPVEPGWPFAPSQIDFREGKIEAFADWLTDPANPLFARVAVNRIWQWHFGEGLHASPSDFGNLPDAPEHRELLDWLAAEFMKCGFRMKTIHRLIVTSQAYQRASAAEPALVTVNEKIDPLNRHLWRFPLRRLEAEAVWDSIFAAAGRLDLSMGGPSFDVRPSGDRRRRESRTSGAPAGSRRAAYMVRGYSTSRDVVPHFLQAFDVEDGRAPCPMRTQTVTAPQALFLMNNDAIERAATQLAERVKQEAAGGLADAVDLAYRLTLARRPTTLERERALSYLGDDPGRLKGLAWLLFNLDEFLYVR
ncbi:MAG TPA: DUF1549 and DUF1553 domain-containing protein [Pirellulales bacterium]|nr:DUF1549 and DUF1553 domain-containing protein [Pirellulales bacterium]